MAVRLAFVLCGQSNALGPNSGDEPAGIPSSDVDYWLRVVGDAATNDDAFRDLDVRVSNDTHSLELQFGLDMFGHGYQVAIVKVARGNTFLSQWVPGTENGNALIAEVTDAKAALEALYPGDTINWHHIMWQGESEAKDTTEDAALAWGSNFDLIEAGLEAVVGPMDPVIIQTHSDTGSAPWIATVQAQQASRAWRLLDVDAVPLDTDETHFTAANYNVVGSLLAELYHAELDTMGTLSAYTRNGMMDLVLGVAAFAPAATHYLAAFVAGTEVTGGAYERKAVTNNATNWPAAAARVKSLGVAQSFVTAAGADWGAIDEIRIYDASSGGNELARDTLASSVTIDDGETLVVEAGAIDITAATGALSDDLAEALLDHVFGSVDITPEATVEFAYFDGDPQGAGAEITGTDYARIVHDNDDVTWDAAASGATRNLIDFSFPAAGAADWDEADYWAIFDAAGTGLMFSAALPVARAIEDGETETIAAGRIRPSFT